MKKNDPFIHWLLEGDVSIQYQVYRDLFGEERSGLQNRISAEGWGAIYLGKRNPHGHWGMGFYQPKWISSHYTLLDLKHLGINPNVLAAIETIKIIVDTEKGEDGGINPSGTISQSDICINGMFLNYAAYFGSTQESLKSVIDFILTQQLPDGGFNCRLNRSGAKHSSLHSTLSVAEGIHEYAIQGYTYRINELMETETAAREFMLMHQLFLSDRTGRIIQPGFLKFPYPSRWKYDILRALDYFRSTGSDPDQRLQPALEILLQKRKKDGTWVLPAKYPGQQHLEMEKPGYPSRWNTLRAMRVLRSFGMIE